MSANIVSLWHAFFQKKTPVEVPPSAKKYAKTLVTRSYAEPRRQTYAASYQKYQIPVWEISSYQAVSVPVRRIGAKFNYFEVR
jgi:hypothetical protein